MTFLGIFEQGGEKNSMNSEESDFPLEVNYMIAKDK